VSLPPPPPPKPPLPRPARRSRRPLLFGILAVILVVAAVDLIGDDEPTSTEDAAGSVASTTPEPEASESSSPSGDDSSQSPEPEEPDSRERESQAVVVRVVDGDTIEVRFRGRTLDVRLIGVDTPETVAPGEPVECYGPAASRFTEQSLEGERVRLEFDVERTDRFGRTLAYVWLGDELFNETLVARGFAQVSTFPPNVKYVDQFVDAERDARRAERGLWGSACEQEEEVDGGDDAGGGAGANCDPSYPGVCIPPYPPDLDCGDVGVTNFQVTGSDPHGFDGDNDGIGCEG
jgi:micrococcal nuclease